ncbi:MAG: hypothetical protein JWN47_952 [Frankiales bacterium]|nr:hypothetical protein [Frankiales bacterium]
MSGTGDWEPQTWIPPHPAGPEHGWGSPVPAPPGTDAGWPSAGPDTWHASPPSSNQGWGPPPQPPRRSNRWKVWVGVGAVVAVLLVVALVNGLRNGGTSGQASGQPSALSTPSAAPTGPSPAPSDGSGGGSPGSALPVVACPTIRDEESHLSYNCVDNYLVQGAADNYLGLRISLNHETEPNWVISEGSGNPKSVTIGPSSSAVAFRQAPTAPPFPAASGSNQALPPPTAAQVQAEVKRRTGLALVSGYGAAPSAKILDEHSRVLSGVTSYELVTEITINPSYRAANKLKVKTERLWVVGVPTKAGVSIFMLTIPDARKDLWPKAEATVGGIRVI